MQKAKKLAGEEVPAKKLPKWKVFEVRALEEALLQHGEGRTAVTRKTVSTPLPSYCSPCACV